MSAGVIAASYVAGYTPSYTHANLAGHWDADQISGRADGDPIGDHNTYPWTDIIAGGAPINGNNMGNLNSANRPVYKTNIRNGHPVVRFDTTDWLEATGRFSSTQTLAIAAKLATASGSTVQIWNGQGSPSTGGSNIVLSGNRGVYVRGVAVPTDGAATTNWERWICVFGAGSTKLYINGTQVVSTSDDMNTTTNTVNTTARLGGSDGGNQSSGGPDIMSGGMDLGEAMIFTAALDTTDVAALDTYLAGKWG
jgi:hypothetical protein